MSRLFRSLLFELDEPLVIEYNNRQTIRQVLVEEFTKSQTKLRYVDIQSHWLRQEVQRGSIQLSWQETKKMMVDGLTKALGKGLFQRFREMIGLEDQTERLSLIWQEDELSEKLIQMKTGKTDYMIAFTYSRDLRRDPWRRRRSHYQGLAYPLDDIVCQPRALPKGSMTQKGPWHE